MALSDFFSRLVRKHPPLGQWLECAREIRPLTSPSGHSWRVTGGDGDYVLRVPGRRPPGADWAAEALAFQTLGDFVPHPLYQDSSDGVLFRPWVDGVLPGEDADLARPVGLLARAHRFSISSLRRLDLDLGGLGDLPLPGAEQVARCFENLAPLAQEAFCHNDPHPGNFILGPSVDWLLDWEYVGVNDPIRDLAYFASWDPGPLDPPFWLSLYGTAVQESAVARFEYGVALGDALSCCWWHQTGGEIPLWRWDRLREATGSPRWSGTVQLAGIPPIEKDEG